ISVHAGRSEFTRIKDTPRRATLKHLRQWTERLTWLESIITPQPFLRGIAHTKIAQFAAEAAALDLGDIRAGDVSQVLIPDQRGHPNSKRLMNSPITRSCMRSVLEKHSVRRINRLIRVRKLMCLLSIVCVFSLPT